MTGWEKRLEDLSDREDIRQCLMRYSRAIDRVDETLLRTVYWPEAVDNHGSYNGSAEGFVAWVIPLLNTMEQTMHFLGNILIETAGDYAHCESYFIAFHRFRDEAGKAAEAHLIGRYIDRMMKRSGEWRILHRDVAYDGYSEIDSPADWDKHAFNLEYRSNRFPDDISCRLFNRSSAGGRSSA